jgi:hypothetical protein
MVGEDKTPCSTPATLHTDGASHASQLASDEGEASFEEEADLRAALEAADRGETMELREEEAEHYYTTGDPPERIEHWAHPEGDSSVFLEQAETQYRSPRLASSLSRHDQPRAGRQVDAVVTNARP